MKLKNEVLGHALLRIGLGLDFLAHGLPRIGGLSNMMRLVLMFLALCLVERKHPGAVTILWDPRSPYYSWGILASGGGYVFARKGADYDLQDVGLAKEFLEGYLLTDDGLATMDKASRLASPR